jgi:hypothetical protein
MPEGVVVAVLETMWGSPSPVRWFRINPLNVSGRRLYRLVSPAELVVTNACREPVWNANQHGVPDPVWLRENLTRLGRLYPVRLVLVCGTVAAKTMRRIEIASPVFHMPHPAARDWTKQKENETKRKISLYI